MPAPALSPLLPSLWEGLASKLGEVYPVGLGKITNFSPFWAVSTDKTELGRNRPSKNGGRWGAAGTPGLPGQQLPERMLCWGREIWGIWEEFLAQKVEATGIYMENPLWPGQLDM